MIPGSKVQKSDASLLAGGFLNLGPAKNMPKKPFSRYHSSGERLFIYYKSVAKELYYKVYVPAHIDL